MKYFDHAASTCLYPEVLENLLESLREDFANPSSQHVLGHDLREKIESVRSRFLKLLGAQAQDFFIFTSSATESNNTVVLGLNLNAGDTIVYSPADHPSLTAPIENLAKKYKCELKKIQLNTDGTINLDQFSDLLSEKVKLVALTHINNQSGALIEIEKITKLVKDKTAAHVHVDAVQSFGKIPVKLSCHIDSMSITSHKIGGPKGIAGLYLKASHKVAPLFLGGGQEKGMRSSTEAFPLIFAFLTAAEISIKNREFNFNKNVEIKKTIETRLMKAIPKLQFSFQHSSPYIFSFVLPGIPSDVLLRHLEIRQVYISSTSACSSKIVGYNPTLAALNIPEKHHKNFIRISLGAQTSIEDAELLIHEFIKVWDDLKHMNQQA